MTINLDRVTATEHIRQIMERHDALGAAMVTSGNSAERRRAMNLRRGLRAVVCSIESTLEFNESVAAELASK